VGEHGPGRPLHYPCSSLAGANTPNFLLLTQLSALARDSTLAAELLESLLFAPTTTPALASLGATPLSVCVLCGSPPCVGRSLIVKVCGAVPCSSVPCGSLPLPCSSFPRGIYSSLARARVNTLKFRLAYSQGARPKPN